MSPQQGYQMLDGGDTIMSPGTLEAVMRCVGAACAGVDDVITGQASNVFCATRPCGHHAEAGQAMGFCVFNQAAIAALHARAVHGLRRVAVMDFDVHHGDGTENILSGDDRVLMVSFFQHPFYPYSGSENPAPNMLNVPLPAYSAGPAVREVVELAWLPRLREFAPQLILISAGFDAHREDDMGQMGLVESDYAWITQRLVQLADRHAQGRIVSCLEGGYALSALGRSVEAHLRVLADL